MRPRKLLRARVRRAIVAGRWVAALYLLGALSCAAHGRDSVSITAAHAPSVKNCALGVPETRVTALDTPDGVDIVFTTTSRSHVAALQARVRDQAAMHGPGTHLGAGHVGVHGTEHGHGLRLWDLSVQAARTDDLEDGARLHVVTRERSDVERLHERAARIAARDCP